MTFAVLLLMAMIFQNTGCSPATIAPPVDIRSGFQTVVSTPKTNQAHSATVVFSSALSNVPEIVVTHFLSLVEYFRNQSSDWLIALIQTEDINIYHNRVQIQNRNWSCNYNKSAAIQIYRLGPLSLSTQHNLKC